MSGEINGPYYPHLIFNTRRYVKVAGVALNMLANTPLAHNGFTLPHWDPTTPRT